MSLGLPQAFLLGTLFEGIFYGAYVIIFTEHIRILYRRRSRSWSYLYLQATSYLLFTLMTMSIILGVIRCMQAFTTEMDTPNFPTTYFEAFNSVISQTRTSVYTAATMVSDLFLVYRCFVVWGNSYLIALTPFLLFLVDLAIAIWSTNSLTVLPLSGDHFEGSLINLRSKYFCIMTLVLNLTCTTLIAYKIWSVQRKVALTIIHTDQPRSPNRIIAIITESAAIYSAFLIALIITDAIDSFSFFVILDVLPPIIGISFSAIIVRSWNTAAPDAIMSTIKFGSRITGSEVAEGSSGGVHVQLETFRYPHSPFHSRTPDEEVQKQRVDA